MRFRLTLFFLLPLFILAQVTDDFSDGDFTANPVWSGDTDDFIVNGSLQLQLNAPEAGTSHLVTAFNMTGEKEWRFLIRCDFSPSDNNMTKVYLMSDQQNVEEPLNGYFLKFGENLSDDAIELYRQNGAEISLICRGNNGLIAAAFQLWIRVRRDNSGLWTIGVDNTGFGAYQTEATGIDHEIVSSSFLGIYCKYTSSNVNNFIFDQFYAGPVVVDTEPPQLVKLEATANHLLDVYFNEALQTEQATNIQNFYVNNNIAYPLVAVQDEQNPGKISLTFDRTFPSGQELKITIQNMTDLSGNVAPSIEGFFTWFTALAFDLQISEIMADPDPAVGLPVEEYLEIYNRTDKEINLNGWTLITGNTSRTFGEIAVLPEGFLLVGDINAAEELETFGPFWGFSGFALTNAGQMTVLKNAAGQVISCVDYSDEWYDSEIKKQGGWSLEQIDPANPCGGKNNWTASVSTSGGTPGMVNSVLAENPDVASPFVHRVEYIDTLTIIVHFSEYMDSTLLHSATGYLIEPDLGNPSSAVPLQPDYSRVMLHLNPGRPVEANTVYTLSVTTELTDCCGNLINPSHTVRFGIPAVAEQNDVVINEILVNPKDTFVEGVEFVEVYNRSGKIIDVQTLVLATEDDITGGIAFAKNISEAGLLLFPSAFLVLTTDPDIVMLQYFAENPEAFIRMDAMPSFANTGGVVVLATKGLQIIDRFAYNENMHIPILTSTAGVSLERIHYDRPAGDPTNWHSAAEDAGYATPGYQNSQFATAIQVDDPVTIDPEIFSPDMDGNDDVLNISYQFQQPGYIADISIYDSRGRMVRKLVNNELLGTEGVFSWDGITDDNQKASIGIYIIFFEVFNTSGNHEKYKKTAVLGGRL